MPSALVAPRLESQPDDKIRVMIVDDSAVVRGLLSRWLEAEPNMEIAGRSRTGAQAIQDVGKIKPDIILLDLEMPEMDGLEALPHLLAAVPGVRVLIASILSQRNASVSLKALAIGAHDYVPKPLSNSGLTTSSEFRVELISKINALCGGVGARQAAADVAQTKTYGDLPAGTRQGRATKPKFPTAVPPNTAAVSVKPAANRQGATGGALPQLRPFNHVVPKVLCIGSSTGGPRAIQTLVGDLASVVQHIPILVTQHMPKAFTSVFSEHLSRFANIPVHEAHDGELLRAGHVYVAPGNRHMMLERRGNTVAVVLDDGPEVNFCKPAVDKMLTSAASVFGKGTLSVILTGMGHDGVAGCRNVVEAGGNVIAQDEQSSVVWGMPGAAYRAGVCSAVTPLESLAGQITTVLQGGKI